jgi:hypothetical protein
VDLRWGITEEQASEGKVLPICLEEIHRCRPYFIGLLGERYGWIPDSVPQEVIDREPWLKEHVGVRTSVTELEILHGVLNNPRMKGHACFYFRNPAYLNEVPEEDREGFVSEDLESAAKLKNLKDRIRKSGLPVMENYADPEAPAEAVRDQFVPLIDRIYPKGEVPDPLDQEAMGHETYARGKLLAFVERPVHTAALDAFADAQSTGQGLVVTGEIGGGKTALLASWVQHWRQSHPHDFVFVHYFGATPDSASGPGFLRRLMGELKRRFEIPDEIPSDPEKLGETLPLWLAQASARISTPSHPPFDKGRQGGFPARIILVLDALNQIQGGEPDRRLSWLPLPGRPTRSFCAPCWRSCASSGASSNCRIVWPTIWKRLLPRSCSAWCCAAGRRISITDETWYAVRSPPSGPPARVLPTPSGWKCSRGLKRRSPGRIGDRFSLPWNLT